MDQSLQIRLVQEDNRVFLDMPDTPENPCFSCGACCAHFRVSFYCGELSEGSGGVVPVEMATMLNPVMACMKGTEAGRGRCIALRGTLGQPGIACTIYENRPTPCREYPTWLDDGNPNPDCQRLRAAIGLPQLLAVSPMPPKTTEPVQVLSLGDTLDIAPANPVTQPVAQPGTHCCKPLLEALPATPYPDTHELNRHQP